MERRMNITIAAIFASFHRMPHTIPTAIDTSIMGEEMKNFQTPFQNAGILLRPFLGMAAAASVKAILSPCKARMPEDSGLSIDLTK